MTARNSGQLGERFLSDLRNGKLLRMRIGGLVRPGSAGRLGLEGLRCLHEISFVILQMQILPGQG